MQAPGVFSSSSAALLSAQLLSADCMLPSGWRVLEESCPIPHCAWHGLMQVTCQVNVHSRSWNYRQTLKGTLIKGTCYILLHKLYNVTTCQLVAKIRCTDYRQTFKLSADNHHISATQPHGKLYVWYSVGSVAETEFIAHFLPTTELWKQFWNWFLRLSDPFRRQRKSHNFENKDIEK